MSAVEIWTYNIVKAYEEPKPLNSELHSVHTEQKQTKTVLKYLQLKTMY
jgi:hypothetical protein